MLAQESQPRLDGDASIGTGEADVVDILAYLETVVRG